MIVGIGGPGSKGHVTGNFGLDGGRDIEAGMRTAVREPIPPKTSVELGALKRGFG